MKLGKSLLMMSCAFGALVGIGAIAMAQEPQQQPRREAEPVGIGEIVVTAEKRAQSVQDVPVAITAFTADMREATGIETPTQQLNFTPGVNYDNWKVTIRGVGNDPVQNIVLGLDPGVSLYQDGFFITPPPMLGVQDIGDTPMLVERIEVLRGPQGTLYGRNSIGGALNRISKRPGDAFEAEARGSINEYQRTRADVRIAGPITDHIRASFGGTAWDQSEGWYQNFAGGPDEGGVGTSYSTDLQVDFDIGDNFDGWIRYAWMQKDLLPRVQYQISPGIQGAYGAGNLSSDPAVPSATRFYTSDTFTVTGVNSGAFDNPLANTQGDGSRLFSTDRPTSSRIDDYHLWIGDFVYHAGDVMDVHYTIGYNSYNNRFESDNDGSAATDITPYNQILYSTVNPLMNQFGILLSGDEYKFDSTPLAATDPFDPFAAGSTSFGAPFHNDQIVVQDANFGAISHELNFTSTHDGPLQWIFGIYYYLEHGDRSSPRYYVDETRPTLAANSTNGWFQFVDSFQYLRTESKAVYGQLDYDLTDTLHASVGLRYTHDDKQGNEGLLITHWVPALIDPDGDRVYDPVDVFWTECGGILACDDNGTPVSNDLLPGGIVNVGGINMTTAALDDKPATRRAADTWNALTGTAGLQWSPNSDTMVYGRYSHGYKSGGFNLGFVTATPLVGPESVDSIEVGWKQNWDHFQLNTAAFFNTFEGQQVYALVEQNGTFLLSLVNMKKSEIYGLELEGIWTPTENLTLLATYGYLHTEIIESGFDTFFDFSDLTFAQPGANPTLNGNELHQSPQNKVALNATYTWNFENDTSFALSGTYNWKDRYYSVVVNTPLTRVPPEDSVDLRATWRAPNDKFALVASVTNLFDADIWTYQDPNVGAPYAPNPTTIYYQPPRIITLEAQFRF
jgi:iron complex outermembrane receptor protein